MTTIVTKSIGASGRDYATHALWISACPSDLVAADEIWAGQSFNDGTFSYTSDTVISGINTDATRYVSLDVGSGQGWNSNPATAKLAASQTQGVLIAYSGGYRVGFNPSIANIKVRNHQITVTGSFVPFYYHVSGSTSSEFENLILESDSSGPQIKYGTVRNCLSIMRSAGGDAWATDYSHATYVNCGAARPTDWSPSGKGWSRANYGLKLTNCWAFGFASFGDGTSGSNNGTDLSSVGFGSANVTSVPYTNATFAGVTDAARNFRLVSGSSLLDAGTTDATDLPAAVDALGTSRPQGSAWDIGPHEFVGGPPPVAAKTLSALGVG